MPRISESLFDEVLSVTLEKRFQDIEVLSEEQKTSLFGLINKRDVFAILPTGHGKSLIFQLLPDVCRELFLRGFQYPKNAIVVVICPLRSLVDSHIREIERYGLRATSLNGEELDEDAILRGEYSFVFASPESFLENDKWRNMLLNDEYQKRLFSFVTDEAHVIPKWGFGSKIGKEQKAAFRKCFARIGELRSIGPEGTPMLALTATANLQTQAEVVKSLSLKKDFLKVYVSPYRKNIYLAKLRVTTNKLKTFAWLIEKLRTEKTMMERTIVYCKSIKDCGRLFKLFKSELGGDSYFPRGCQKESQNLLFGMYHHNTLDKHKERILNSFHDKDGVCRLVFATNALGMGINFPNVRNVINYGPPREVEELVQEIGRAGRDGQPALGVLLYHGRHLRKCENTIIEYCNNSDGCLRKHLASQFEQIQELIFECGTHDCCLNCHKSCDCEEECSVPIPCFASSSNVQKEVKKRKVSEEDKALLEELLLDHKDNQQTGLVTYLNPECTAGFSSSLVKAVLKHCHQIFTLEDIVSTLPVFKRSHAIDILNMLHDVFEDIDGREMEFAMAVDTDCLEKEYDLTYNQGYESQSSGTSSEEDNE